jgi:hypothetical protein
LFIEKVVHCTLSDSRVLRKLPNSRLSINFSKSLLNRAIQPDTLRVTFDMRGGAIGKASNQSIDCGRGTAFELR